MMDGQLTIFDMIQPADPDINDIPEEEAVRLVGEALGVVFKYNDFFGYYEAKKGKLKMSLEYDNFNLEDNHDRFLGAGYTFGTSGGGSPTSGIAQAVRYFRDKIQQYAGREPEKLT